MAEPNSSETKYLGFSDVNGQLYPPQVLPCMHENMKNFEVRDDDVFIVTYSKAGTHWMTEIVKTILVDGDYEKGMELFGEHPNVVEYFNTCNTVAKSPRDKQRVVVSHLEEETLPQAVFNSKVKVVFVMRNPKDTAVSYYHFAKPFKYSEQWDTWDSFLQSFMSDEMPGKSWFDYNLSYWKHRNDDNFFSTTYEDMKMDIKSVIKEVANFLGRRPSDSTLNKLISVSKFSKMNKKYDGKMPEHAPENVKHLPFTLLRKGCVGDWKNTFTVAQNETFDELYEKKMGNSSMREAIKFEI